MAKLTEEQKSLNKAKLLFKNLRRRELSDLIFRDSSCRKFTGKSLFSSELERELAVKEKFSLLSTSKTGWIGEQISHNCLTTWEKFYEDYQQKNKRS